MEVLELFNRMGNWLTGLFVEQAYLPKKMVRS